MFHTFKWLQKTLKWHQILFPKKSKEMCNMFLKTLQKITFSPLENNRILALNWYARKISDMHHFNSHTTKMKLSMSAIWNTWVFNGSLCLSIRLSITPDFKHLKKSSDFLFSWKCITGVKDTHLSLLFTLAVTNSSV